jgi:iron complex transport system ATP-binding protein
VKIEAVGVEFAYKNYPVLRGLDFSASAGDVVAVLGPNGVGKSTLFRCILGFLKPRKGHIYIDGVDTLKLSSAEMAGRIAYIPQSVSPVFNYTVQDTVLMGLTNQLGTFQSPRPRDVKKAVEVLESLGIAHLRHRGCGQISGGERQLTLLARALVQNAGVLVMDEPTANLDYGNSWRVMERIGRLAGGGYTVLFSTHDPNQAFMHASHVLVMKSGAILTFGPPREVLTEKTLSEVYNISVILRTVPYKDGEAVISIPNGSNKP